MNNRRQFFGDKQVGSRLYGENVGAYPQHHFYWLDISQTPVQLPFYVYSGGYDLMCRGVWRQRENCNVCSFELVAEGEMKYDCDGGSYQCLPGDLFILHLGSKNRMECVSKYVKQFNIMPGGVLLNAVLSQLRLNTVEYIHLKTPELFIREFEAIGELLRQHRPELFAEIAARGYQVLCMLSAELNQKNYPLLLKNLLAYLETAFGAPVRMASLARKFNVCPRTIFSLFREQLGQSPIDYLIDLRIRKARLMLLESNKPIKEIAAACGYASQLYFSQEFRRRSGASPSEYRCREQEKTGHVFGGK